MVVLVVRRRYCLLVSAHNLVEHGVVDGGARFVKALATNGGQSLVLNSEKVTLASLDVQLIKLDLSDVLLYHGLQN